MAQNFSELANFLWSAADHLRGDYRQSDYGKVILSPTLLRRLECVLENTKAEVLDEFEKRKDTGVSLDVFLKRKSKQAFAEIVIEAQDAHNLIAEQLLKDERIMETMQGMLAKMVRRQFQAGIQPKTFP